ncbi:hypothetical protein KSP40_PGU000016 [Platanthera guangdongensis]|uniref:Uncharacterized protein n=1 Tax=Platanthera guangdongensis TaxID=2320717 RepID=A0ABR2LV17_9ASPA
MEMFQRSLHLNGLSPISCHFVGSEEEMIERCEISKKNIAATMPWFPAREAEWVRDGAAADDRCDGFWRGQRLLQSRLCIQVRWRHNEGNASGTLHSSLNHSSPKDVVSSPSVLSQKNIDQACMSSVTMSNFTDMCVWDRMFGLSPSRSRMKFLRQALTNDNFAPMFMTATTVPKDPNSQKLYSNADTVFSGIIRKTEDKNVSLVFSQYWIGYLDVHGIGWN